MPTAFQGGEEATETGGQRIPFDIGHEPVPTRPGPGNTGWLQDRDGGLGTTPRQVPAQGRKRGRAVAVRKRQGLLRQPIGDP